MYNSMMARGANFYDEATSPGECDALLASGALTCHDDFAPGMSLAGYCEFACDFCPIIGAKPSIAPSLVFIAPSLVSGARRMP